MVYHGTTGVYKFSLTWNNISYILCIFPFFPSSGWQLSFVWVFIHVYPHALRFQLKIWYRYSVGYKTYSVGISPELGHRDLFQLLSLGTWRPHQMKTLSASWALCEGNPPVIGGFSSQWPVTWSFDIFFRCAWTNGWGNNRDAGDLGRRGTHCDVIVMTGNYHYSLILQKGVLGDVLLLCL